MAYRPEPKKKRKPKAKPQKFKQFYGNSMARVYGNAPAVTLPGPKPKPKPPVDPITAQLEAIFGPEQSYLQNLIRSQTEQANAAQARRQALNQEYAKYYAQHTPQQIQGIYSQAANDQSAFAKGFSDGMQHIQQQGASQANDIMGLAGAPQGQMIQPNSDAADVLYGTGGFFPASTLSQQGAAFASAAALMPGAIVAQGNAAAAKERAASGESIAKLEDELAKLMQKKSEAGLKIREARRAEKIKLAIENAKLKAAAKKDAEMMAYRYASLDLRQKAMILSDKRAAQRIFQAQQRLGLTQQNQSFNQWYKQQTLALSQGRYNNPHLQKGPGGSVFDPQTGIYYRNGKPWVPPVTSKSTFIDPLTGAPLSPAEIKGYKDDAFLTINNGIHKRSEKPWQIMIDLADSPIPPAIWRAVVVKKWNTPYNADEKALRKMGYSKLFQTAVFWGFRPPPNMGSDHSAVSRNALIASILENRGKASAALSGGVQTGANGNPQLNYLASLWVKAGGDPSVAQQAAAIAMAESSGNRNARLHTGQEDSRGLWQINTYAHPWAKNLYDPLANARAAVRIYKDNGGFGPWSTYTNGAYQQYMGGGRKNVGYSGNATGVKPNVIALANEYGLTITSGFRSVAEQTRIHNANPSTTGRPGHSLHNFGLAIDVAPDARGKAFLRFAMQHPELFQEVFYDPWNVYIKNGKLYRKQLGGHSDHIHIGLYAGERI